MTVYSINTRAIEQATGTAVATNGSAKTTDDAIAEFASALQQATSAMVAGNTASRNPSAETALKSHFDRQTDTPRQSSSSKTTSTSSKQATRDTSRDDDSRVTRSDDDTADADDSKTVKTAPQDDDSAPAKTADDKSQSTDQDNGQTATQDQAAPEPQAVAVVVQPQQQVQQVVTETAPQQTTTSQAAAQPAQQQAPEQKAADQTQGDTKPGDTQTNADTQPDTTLLADAAQTTDATGPKKAAADAHAMGQSQTQADDLAQRLDDTGAQIKVQVQVTTAQQGQDSAVTTPQTATTSQDVAAPVQPTFGQDQNAGSQSGQQQEPSLAAQTQQVQANADAAAQAQANATQTNPFEAVMAAQADANDQADTTTPSQQQNGQPVAALNGVAGTTATQKASAAQATQAARQPQLPTDKEIMDQISVQIAKQGKDGDTIKVQLKPTELGSIEIKMDVAKDGTVTTVVTADNKDTLDLLKRDQSGLQKALTDAGLKSDLGSMSFNLREGNQQQTAQNSFNGGSGRRRARLEAAAAADAASAKAAAVAQARWGTGRSGVDIQV